MPSRTQRSYANRNVVRAVLNTPWLITTEKMDAILGFLEMRAAGYQPSEAEIHAMLAVAPTGIDVFLDDENKIRDVDGTRLLQLSGVMAPKMNLMAQISGGTSTEKLRAEVNKAGADDRVKNVLLLVDSPGGVAPMTRELSDAIFALRQEKPVTVFSNVEMNSAAYWAGTAGTEVVASPSSTNGNIGVFHVLKESTKRNESQGDKYVVLREGGLKGAGNEFEELSPERQASVQDHLNAIMKDFVAGVSRNLGVSAETVRSTFGDGASFLAEEALDRGMVHRVSTLEEVVGDMTSRTTAAPGSSFRSPIGGKGGTGMITQKIRAALYACELVDSVEASEETCLTAVKLLARVHDIQLSESTPEQDIIDLVTGKKEAEKKAMDSQAAADAEKARLRADEIRSIGKLLGVSSESIDSQVRSTNTVDQVRELWKQELVVANQPVNLVPGMDSRDKIESALVNSLLERTGYYDIIDPEGLAYASSFRNNSAMDMVYHALDACGIRRTGNPNQDAAAFLAMGCAARSEAMADSIGGPSIYRDGGYGSHPLLSEPSYNRAGDHPDALSNLMGRILENVYGKMSPTYLAWTRRLPDVPNFKENEIIDAGTFHELDVMLEDERFPQLKFSTQLRAYFRAFKHGGKTGLTVEMLTNDDLSVFSTQFQDMALAPEQTVDRTSRNLLASNPVMFEDDTPMFDAAHGNLVASGGAPDATTASDMRRLLRKIKGFDADIPANEVAAGVVVPSKHENAAIQVYTPLAGQPENKVPVTDSNLNTVRGLTVTTDADLDRYDEDAWYLVGREQLKPIGVGYVRGFGGPGGMRSTWVDPDTGTRWAAIMVAFAISAVQWRGIIKNPGV